MTAFEYRLHPVGPRIIAGGVVHPLADTPRVFAFFADYVAGAPDELSVVASTFRATPPMPVPPEFHGELVTVPAVCWAGDLDAGERAPAPLRAFGDPLADLVTTMPYTVLQTGSDASYPDGRRNSWKSQYVDTIDEDLVAGLTEHGPRMTSPLSSFHVQHLGGAIARPGPESAAFGHRDHTFDFTILTVWRDPAQDDEHIAWARAFHAAIAPRASGVCVNHLGVEGADRVRAAYAPRTWARLVALKDRHDPDNVFRLDQSIVPSGG